MFDYQAKNATWIIHNKPQLTKSLESFLNGFYPFLIHFDLNYYYEGIHTRRYVNAV